MKIWYEKPAIYWHEALPVGNGRIGGMVYGGTGCETIKLNEDSIWSGKPLNRINPDALKRLPVIRKYIREGKIEEAQRLSMYALSGVPNSQRAYQPAGECYIQMHHDTFATGYKRELDLETGIVYIEYTADGVGFFREVYVSGRNHCMMIRIGTKERTPFSFDARLGRCHNNTDEVFSKGNNTVLFTANT